MVKWVTPTSTRSFLAIAFVIASLVRAINGFLPIQLNGSARASSGTDARKLFGGYRITPKHCRATKTLPISDPRVNGPTICMFNHECAQRGGEVVGACMDGFLFGACCQIPNVKDVESTLINDAQNAYYQQYQQHKLQLQAAVSNPAAAQSYENYGESIQQQSTEVGASSSTQAVSSYPTTPQVVSSMSSSSYQPESTYSSTTASNNANFNYKPSAETDKSDAYTSSQSEQESDSSSPWTESVLASSTKTANVRPTTTHAAAPIVQPPRVHVHKDSVKISSPSSPPHNDDFVMQVLSTLPPDHEDHITFTTEVPMKIASSSADQQSSESNSFEEEPSVTQMPIQLIEKPLKHSSEPGKSQPHPEQQIPQQTQPQQHKHQSNMHHHNHLLLDGNEFTHSSITHPGADADIMDEDLQFSSGYGVQPTIVEPPKNSPSASSYNPNESSKTPQVDDKYVLVQTITNEQGYQQPVPAANNPTTSSSITTHVDSIESIILQLNNTNHGPIYSVVGQGGATSDSYSTLPSYTDSSSSGNANKDSYSRPAPSAATEGPAAYFSEIETKRPEDYHQQKYSATPAQVPSYPETVTTNVNFMPENEYAADVMAENNNYGSSSHKPQPSASAATYTDDSAAVLDEHTVPDKNYNDVAASGHQTSEFNKMPAVGIAYPVDMSYMEEEGNIAIGAEESSGYQKLPTSTTSQRPTASYNTKAEQADAQTATTYTRLPMVTEHKPSKHPVASYIGVVTGPMYNQQPQATLYNQVPNEVSVQSYTTKVQEEHSTPSGYQTTQNQKLTTINYVDLPVTPAYVASSLPTSAPRPPYESLILGSTTKRPKPAKRPGHNNTKKTSKPHTTRKPTTTYNQVSQNDYQDNSYKKPTTSHTSSKVPTTSSYNTHSSGYNQEPTEAYLTNSYPLSSEKQPSNQYDSHLTKPKTPTKLPQPSNSYAQDSSQTPTQPASTYHQEGYISTQTAKPTTRRPISSKKPISTSYVTGPSSPRPPTTFAYDNEVPPLIITDGKLDSFVQNTANSAAALPTPIANVYQAPVYANAVTPVQVQQPQSSYNTHKKPGFVKVKHTPRPSTPTIIITPKPTASSYVKQPSYDSSFPSSTPYPAFASTSYIYSPTITPRPDFSNDTPEYVSLPPITSNDFDDPGYYGGQGANVLQTVTEPNYAIPSDDRPAFPGYYGPTPTYPAFSIPDEKNEGTVEETYTSPNDFVNFPPVRNPNLNMSAASSAVTSDLELSTPAFVEDGVLKDKMNTLVHKIVESLQGNFEALADLIDEPAASTYQAGGGGDAGATTLGTKKPTTKPGTTKPKATTKKPVTRITTRKPTVTTRKPATKRTTTRKPVTTRKPTKTTPTTNAAPFQDEIIDEEDEEDVNPSDNEINDSDTGTVGVGAGGRKIQCGVRPHVKSGRIVGGKGSTFGAYPWQVLVRESTWLGLFTKNKCGGVLITNKYVITAAHCQPGFLASLVAVMGEFDISGDLESKKAVTKNVKRVIVHRQYDPATFENDLALLEMESPVQFDTHIVPICMPSDYADFTGRMATVTGWGRLKYGGGVPSVLQEVQVPVIENNVCQEMFHTAGHNKKILNSFLCAGYANGQKDSCEGDSGGPLVLQRPDGRYELAGTVSHGIKCAAPYLPGVYMRTTYYKPWLRSITGVK